MYLLRREKIKEKRKKKAIFLPANLYEKVEKRIDVTEFHSVEEYVTFVLEKVLEDEKEEVDTFNKEEEEEVKKRLRALGYLD